MIKRCRNEVDMHFGEFQERSRKKETSHGQKDLIKTSFLHEIIKEISSSNGQSHATKKNNACNVKRQRKDKEIWFRQLPTGQMQIATDSAGNVPKNDHPIGW